MPLPKEVHILIPGACECITFCECSFSPAWMARPQTWRHRGAPIATRGCLHLAGREDVRPQDFSGPFWGLLPRHGHHVVVPVTAATAECCGKPGRGLLCSPRSLGSSSEWEGHGLGGRGTQGVGRQAVHRRALGGEGEGPQMTTTTVHPASASRANCFQPCPQLCSAPPRGLSRRGHTEQTGRESPVWLSGGKALLTTVHTSLFLLSRAKLPSST